MSFTYNLICHECKQYIWIGQGWSKADFQLYRSPENLAALRQFMAMHENHPLKFSHDDFEIMSEDGTVYNELESNGFARHGGLINRLCKKLRWVGLRGSRKGS